MSSAPQVTKGITLRSVLRDLGILFVLLVVFDALWDLKWRHPLSVAGDFAYWVLFFTIFYAVKWAVSLADGDRNRSQKDQPDRDEAHRA